MKKNYHITCSDAGAANLIYHWYIANKKRYFFSFDLSGPAKKIFKKKSTFNIKAHTPIKISVLKALKII